MSKLHKIFLKKDRKINRSQAVKELLQEENLNINVQNENGDTVLHLMVKHMFDNYYNPFMQGPFYMDGSDYKGPGFLDDLEVLLAIGADPTIKNNNNTTPIELVFSTPKVWDWLGGRDLSRYLNLVQKYYPDFSSLIKIVEHGAYRSDEKFRKETLMAVSYWSESWINNSLPKVLDERYLSLECLKELIKWINKGHLKELGATDETVTKIYNCLVTQIKIQTSGLFLLDGVEKLVYEDRTIILRGMLLNDPKCPVYDYIEQLTMLDLTNLLTKELNSNFEELLVEYNQKYTLLKEIKAHPDSLSQEEVRILKSISETLDNSLNSKIMQAAYKDFNERSNSFEPQKFMVTRWNLFKENNTNQYQTVIEELKQRVSST